MKKRTKITLQLVAICLIVLSFVVGQLSTDPLAFGLTMPYVAPWLGLLNGTIALVLHFLPSPPLMQAIGNGVQNFYNVKLPDGATLDVADPPKVPESAPADRRPS